MRPCLFQYLVCVVFFSASAFAFDPQFDTGFIEWSQPNQVTFTAKAWGDDHLVWYETEDGYRFVTRGDGWHCYATLDQYGEFAPSEYLVAIDEPPKSAYHLERTQERMNQIEEWLAAADPYLDTLFQHYRQLQAQRNAEERPLVIRVNVLLVEFLDVRHFQNPEHPRRPLGYLKADFDSMLFSHNWWIGGQNNNRHPEGDSIFGSLRDFYDQMSLGKFQVEGHVVNPPDANGIPTWITLADSQSFYGGVPSYEGFDRLLDSAFARAVAYHWLAPADTPNDTLKYIVVYAGNLPPSSVQWTGAGYWSGHFKMCERKGYAMSNYPPVTFTHFGWPAHEFGHLFGFNDEYESGYFVPHINNSTTIDYELMAMGEHNGPGRRGGCPASLSPFYRIGMYWVPSIPIERDTTNFGIAYDYQAPRFYRIDPQPATGDEHYIIETRNRQGFDFYLPNHPDNFVTQPGTLLIWHHNGRDNEGNLDRICLMFADDVVSSATYGTDFFPKDDSPNGQDFNDLSVPRAILGFHFPPRPGLSVEHPAYFALNGIHRSGDSTIIDTVSPFTVERLVTIPVAENWNILSVPLTLQNYLKTTVFPEAISAAFAYVPGSGYVQRDTLKNGLGYWIKFGSNPSLILGGGVRETDTVSVLAGWNVVGSITDSTDSARVCLHPYPQNSFRSSFFRYDNGYTTSRIIEPGRGYWVKVLMDGQLVFHHDPVQCGAMVDLEVSEFDHFIVTDAQGKKQDVYVANLDRDPSLAQIDLSMPPPFPEVDFDARFEAGEFVKTVSPDSGVVELVINVETQAYPVTVTWELNPENGIEYSIITEGMGKPQSHNRLTRSGSASMTTSHGGKFRFNAQAGRARTDDIPTTYLLSQNYPNPFNPSTRIHYELPQDGVVRLVIIDVLGREVTKLVNEAKVAGKYDASFNTTGLASGVYFYRLQAGTYVNTKKMILVK